ncbi:MAG: SRPBCC family protein [Chloroflexi bacterium]|nr:SRPBCC family protein [Chloroflexota bacterium]
MFTAQRISHSHTLEFTAFIEQVFPLFTPVKEKLWLAQWQFTPIYHTTKSLEEAGAVFKTQHGDQSEEFWVMADYDPQQHRVQYVRFLPDLLLTTIDIQCLAMGDKTRVTVTYTRTGLSEAGNAKLASITAESYREQMAFWQHAIEHYLATGTALVGVH